MRFMLTIDCDNAAFHDDECRLGVGNWSGICDCDNMRREVSRILYKIATSIDGGGISGFFETIRDLNGNDVGRWALKANPDDPRFK